MDSGKACVTLTKMNCAFAQLNCANAQPSPKGRRRINKFCQRLEKLLGFAGML
jgi:hypothetical protein